MASKLELKLYSQAQARRQTSLFAPPDQLRLFGRAEGHVIFGVEEELIAGEFQDRSEGGRRFVEAELRRVRIVRGPGARYGDGLVRQRSVGHVSFLPRAVAAREAMVCAVHPHQQGRRLAAGGFESDG